MSTIIFNDFKKRFLKGEVPSADYWNFYFVDKDFKDDCETYNYSLEQYRNLSDINSTIDIISHFMRGNIINYSWSAVKDDSNLSNKPMFITTANAIAFNSFPEYLNASANNPYLEDYIENYGGFYVIRSKDELTWFADRSNTGNNKIVGVLFDDIGGVLKDSVIGKNEEFPFEGVLDGNGFSIYDTEIICNEINNGLVGVLGKNGIIRNFIIKNSTVENEEHSIKLICDKKINLNHIKNDGRNINVGILCGKNFGTIENVSGNFSLDVSGFIPEVYSVTNKSDKYSDFTDLRSKYASDNTENYYFLNSFCINSPGNICPYVGYFNYGIYGEPVFSEYYKKSGDEKIFEWERIPEIINPQQCDGNKYYFPVMNVEDFYGTDGKIRLCNDDKIQGSCYCYSFILESSSLNGYLQWNDTYVEKKYLPWNAKYLSDLIEKSKHDEYKELVEFAKRETFNVQMIFKNTDESGPCIFTYMKGNVIIDEDGHPNFYLGEPLYEVIDEALKNFGTKLSFSEIIEKLDNIKNVYNEFTTNDLYYWSADDQKGFNVNNKICVYSKKCKLDDEIEIKNPKYTEDGDEPENITLFKCCGYKYDFLGNASNENIKIWNCEDSNKLLEAMHIPPEDNPDDDIKPPAGTNWIFNFSRASEYSNILTPFEGINLKYVEGDSIIYDDTGKNIIDIFLNNENGYFEKPEYLSKIWFLDDSHDILTKDEETKQKRVDFGTGAYIIIYNFLKQKFFDEEGNADNLNQGADLYDNKPEVSENLTLGMTGYVIDKKNCVYSDFNCNNLAGGNTNSISFENPLLSFDFNYLDFFSENKSKYYGVDAFGDFTTEVIKKNDVIAYYNPEDAEAPRPEMGYERPYSFINYNWNITINHLRQLKDFEDGTGNFENNAFLKTYYDESLSDFDKDRFVIKDASVRKDMNAFFINTRYYNRPFRLPTMSRAAYYIGSLAGENYGKIQKFSISAKRKNLGNFVGFIGGVVGLQGDGELSSGGVSITDNFSIPKEMETQKDISEMTESTLSDLRSSGFAVTYERFPLIPEIAVKKSNSSYSMDPFRKSPEFSGLFMDKKDDPQTVKENLLSYELKPIFDAGGLFGKISISDPINHNLEYENNKLITRKSPINLNNIYCYYNTNSKNIQYTDNSNKSFRDSPFSVFGSLAAVIDCKIEDINVSRDILQNYINLSSTYFYGFKNNKDEDSENLVGLLNFSENPIESLTRFSENSISKDYTNENPFTIENDSEDEFRKGYETLMEYGIDIPIFHAAANNNNIGEKPQTYEKNLIYPRPFAGNINDSDLIKMETYYNELRDEIGINQKDAMKNFPTIRTEDYLSGIILPFRDMYNYISVNDLTIGINCNMLKLQSMSSFYGSQFFNFGNYYPYNDDDFLVLRSEPEQDQRLMERIVLGVTSSFSASNPTVGGGNYKHNLINIDKRNSDNLNNHSEYYFDNNIKKLFNNKKISDNYFYYTYSSNVALENTTFLLTKRVEFLTGWTNEFNDTDVGESRKTQGYVFYNDTSYTADFKPSENYKYEIIPTNYLTIGESVSPLTIRENINNFRNKNEYFTTSGFSANENGFGGVLVTDQKENCIMFIENTEGVELRGNSWNCYFSPFVSQKYSYDPNIKQGYDPLHDVASGLLIEVK